MKILLWTANDKSITVKNAIKTVKSVTYFIQNSVIADQNKRRSEFLVVALSEMLKRILRDSINERTARWKLNRGESFFVLANRRSKCNELQHRIYIGGRFREWASLQSSRVLKKKKKGGRGKKEKEKIGEKGKTEQEGKKKWEGKILDGVDCGNRVTRAAF